MDCGWSTGSYCWRSRSFIPAWRRRGRCRRHAGYTVLEPIRHGALTVFPVVAGTSHDTREFITLDEGLRSGEVVISEAGSVSPLVRPRPE